MCQASAGEAAPLLPLIGFTRVHLEQKTLFCSSHTVHPFVQHFTPPPDILTQRSHTAKRNWPASDDKQVLLSSVSVANVSVLPSKPDNISHPENQLLA